MQGSARLPNARGAGYRDLAAALPTGRTLPDRLATSSVKLARQIRDVYVLITASVSGRGGVWPNDMIPALVTLWDACGGCWPIDMPSLQSVGDLTGLIAKARSA